MGAWIEIVPTAAVVPAATVAPYMGAWIEIVSYNLLKSKKRSLPTWGRGLKSQILGELINSLDVAPYMGAWIEMTGQR